MIKKSNLLQNKTEISFAMHDGKQSPKKLIGVISRFWLEIPNITKFQMLLRSIFDSVFPVSAINNLWISEAQIQNFKLMSGLKLSSQFFCLSIENSS